MSPENPRRRRRRVVWLGAAILAASTAAAVAYAASTRDLFLKVPPGHLAILIRKTGRPLPPGATIAPRPAPGEEPFQGVQEHPLPPGWYPTGYNPYDWGWEIVPQTQIPPDHVGVLVRTFGEDLPDGQVLADENPEDERLGIVRKGVLRRTLEPGTHPINTRAYDVRVLNKVTIQAGQVGVVTRRAGMLPRDRASLLSEPDERGVQKAPLTPGSYYLNPFVAGVNVVSTQSQRLDLHTKGRVVFPSSDGFEIALSGTVEWSLPDGSVPSVFVKFGDTNDTERKLVLPAARAKSRLQGSRKPAREFITGRTRQTFQDDFGRDLAQVVEAEGPKVHSVLISGIVPPDQIAKPMRDREISLLERARHQVQMETERSRALLASQTESEKRPQLLAKAQGAAVEMNTAALQRREVKLIEARRDLEVARLERDAAAKQAEAKVAQGAALVQVARARLEAEGEALRQRIEAHGGGVAYARSAFFEKIAPRFASILANTDGPLADVFRQLTRDEAPRKDAK